MERKAFGGSLEVSQVMLKGGSKEQSDPTPNGYGIDRSPHRSWHSGLRTRAIENSGSKRRKIK
ncbi:hypothetical protein C2S51_006660 [Perilla frutescens var. frutescens]|nr:hypothetical protein C2S51_006660 [Perilla frutescens var. frutescens]